MWDLTDPFSRKCAVQLLDLIHYSTNWTLGQTLMQINLIQVMTLGEGVRSNENFDH